MDTGRVCYRWATTGTPSFALVLDNVYLPFYTYHHCRCKLHTLRLGTRIGLGFSCLFLLFLTALRALEMQPGTSLTSYLRPPSICLNLGQFLFTHSPSFPSSLDSQYSEDQIWMMLGFWTLSHCLSVRVTAEKERKKKPNQCTVLQYTGYFNIHHLIITS